MATIIYDFNRTLFDPDTESLLPGARALLSTQAQAGFTLHLVSRNEPGRTHTLIELGIQDFFTSTAFVSDKEDTFRSLIETSDRSRTYVIGDHLHSDIRYGNRFGAKTIWLKRGRFKDFVPETQEDIPLHTIQHLEEVPFLIVD